MAEQLCSWSPGLACRWNMVQIQTAWQQGGHGEGEAERRKKNDFNSAVTREMSNTGHMGFTAKGLRGNGHRVQRRRGTRLMASQRDTRRTSEPSPYT